MAALDASASLIEIAGERLSAAADVRQEELGALPFNDKTFDVVTAVNSIFYAADTAAAISELRPFVRPGGRVVVTAWGPPNRCEFLSAVMPLVFQLMPPHPFDAPPAKPAALYEPGALEAAIEHTRMSVLDSGEVAHPFF